MERRPVIAIPQRKESRFWELHWVIQTSCEPISAVPLKPSRVSDATDPFNPGSARGVVAFARSARVPDLSICPQVPPDLAFDFAAEHDVALREVPQRDLGVKCQTHLGEVANLVFSIGGLGLRSAPRAKHCSLVGPVGQTVSTQCN